MSSSFSSQNTSSHPSFAFGKVNFFFLIKVDFLASFDCSTSNNRCFSYKIQTRKVKSKPSPPCCQKQPQTAPGACGPQTLITSEHTKCFTKEGRTVLCVLFHALLLLRLLLNGVSRNTFTSVLIRTLFHCTEVP